ncbi:HIT family protein [Streptomyces sp. NPDC050704]|uniref:HIT family protein n=1 Tax=Streptomyces sp. NPDC050704 TaxID=3157219 RepID=UPI00341C2A91
MEHQTSGNPDCVDCAFCAIAKGAAFARVVREDHDTLAFLPLRPVTDGHVLVVPRRHIPNLWHLDDPTAMALTRTVLRVAHAVRTAFRPAGLNVVNSAGAAATQSVMHIHVHVVPRYEGDPMGNFWPPPAPLDPARLDAAAERLRTVVRAGSGWRPSAEQHAYEEGDMGDAETAVEQ